MPETVTYFIIAALAAAVLVLTGRLHVLRKTIREIDEGLNERLDIDTNTQVSISSLDRYTRKLASDINGELKRLKKEQQKYESKNTELKTSITNIAHDIRTPLTAINGYLELFRDAEINEKERNWLSIIQERTDNLKELADDLFAYSVASVEQENLTLEQVSLNDELAATIAEFYGAFKSAQIEPEIEIPDEPVYRTLDKKALGRILSNLFSNTLKYSSGDFKVSLKPDGIITLSNRAEGMTAVDAEKLFERFYTVQTAKGSTGLGLSIARMLTERMNGTISAEYKEKKLSITIKWN